MKRSGIVPVLILMLAALSGCSGKSGTSSVAAGKKTDSSTAPVVTISGKSEIDTGVLSVKASGDWYVFNAQDVYGKFDGDIDPNVVIAAKGYDVLDADTTCPQIWIEYYPDKSKYTETADVALRENVKDINETIGDRKWTGTSYESFSVPGLTITSDAGDGLLYVGALLGAQNDAEKVTFLDAHDEDVMNIIKSIRLD